MEPRANFEPESWHPGDLSRVPFPLYSDPAIYEREQVALFRGPIWHYLGLEAEIPNPGDWRTTQIGDAPVVLARALDGSLNAFENRCAHRGALLCLAPAGNSKTLTCVYHAWGYDLKGNLTGVAFRRGVQGKGGMPAEFDMKAHGLRKLRVASLSGIVFATYSEAAPALETYLGPEIVTRIRRVMKSPPKVLGYFTQTLPNNWKLYIENVKDSYHASLLHLFFTTFELNRLSQPGGIIVDDSGGHHVSYSMIAEATGETEYAGAGLRSDREGYRLADPSMLMGKDEFGDGITLQILTVFPTFVLQQIQNCLALRQIVPTGTGETALHWTYFGFADDDAEMELLRMKQANLIGPGGYISMEDGAVGGFVQRAIAGAGEDATVLMMGGVEAESQDTRATESSIRGFWKAYRALMDL